MTVGAALYVRVSTGDQDLDTQERDLRSYAERQGWEVVSVYREAVSATGRKPRPEFEKLRTAISSHSFDTVLVVKLDRLARSVRDALEFFAEAESNGVRVVVTTQDIDTGTPSGRLTRTILAGVAEFEGELIRDRTRGAMAAIKAGTKLTRTGQKPGRPRKVHPDDVERARDLREKGHSWAQVAQTLGLKAETLRRALWALKAAPVTVVNPPAGETGSSPGEEHDRD